MFRLKKLILEELQHIRQDITELQTQEMRHAQENITKQDFAQVSVSWQENQERLLSSQKEEISIQIQDQTNALTADISTLSGQLKDLSTQMNGVLQTLNALQTEQANQTRLLQANQEKEPQSIDKNTVLALLSGNASMISELFPIDNSIPSKLLLLSRQTILNRWFCIDSMDSLRFPPDKKIRCTICGYEAEKNSFDTKISDCIFNGGKLERFVCPRCGTIFGPLKMLELTPQQLEDDYRIHYMNYAEGDSTESELLCFSEIDRGPDKTYLNFGAGAWSHSSQILREKGYTIFDYEPYAHCSNHQWLITNPEDLKSRKFDGIFSNDLIEHLRNPIADLKNMTALLQDADCRMAHSTGCFDYAYEYTRFHLHFLPLTALQIIAKHCDLNVTLIRKESPTNTNFKVAVFSANQNGVQS